MGRASSCFLHGRFSLLSFVHGSFLFCGWCVGGFLFCLLYMGGVSLLRCGGVWWGVGWLFFRDPVPSCYDDHRQEGQDVHGSVEPTSPGSICCDLGVDGLGVVSDVDDSKVANSSGELEAFDSQCSQSSHVEPLVVKTVSVDADRDVDFFRVKEAEGGTQILVHLNRVLSLGLQSDVNGRVPVHVFFDDRKENHEEGDETDCEGVHFG